MVRLRSCPAVQGLPDDLTEIDFFVRGGELRLNSDARREMTGAECVAVISFLDRMAVAARRAVEGSP